MAAPKVQWLDEYCNTCGNQINSWDKRCCRVLAYKKPVCESCMAKEYGKTTDEMRDTFEHFFGMRPCQGI